MLVDTIADDPMPWCEEEAGGKDERKKAKVELSLHGDRALRPREPETLFALRHAATAAHMSAASVLASLIGI